MKIFLSIGIAWIIFQIYNDRIIIQKHKNKYEFIGGMLGLVFESTVLIMSLIYTWTH